MARERAKRHKDAGPLRRSPRFAVPQPSQRRQQLPSPTPSTAQTDRATVTKKRKAASEGLAGERASRKRVRRESVCPLLSTGPPLDPVAHWVEQGTWPPVEMQKQAQMGRPSSKRKSSSTHHSDKRRLLKQHGIYMETSMPLQKDSKQFCEQLLGGNREPSNGPGYPLDKIDDVLSRVSDLNEARLQRDVMPWVVPSAEHLHLSGVSGYDFIGEEIDAEWSRCDTMGLSRPKPDFAAGLKRSAFSAEDLEKLENYGTAQQPFCFTPNVSFPFLMCEAKTGQVGLDQADSQNMHSASIAIRAILSLYAATFGREDHRTIGLLGRVLVFTVSHNNSLVNVYGHYAVAAGESDTGTARSAADAYQYHRYGIAMYSFSMHDGKDRFQAYNFVRNLYDTFAPQHLDRIRDATHHMQKPTRRTGLSFVASDIALDEESSQPSSDFASQEEEVFKAPSEPASISQKREIASMGQQIGRLLQQLEQQRKESKEQLEQQRKESKEQLEQQRKESKEQLEQQRKESKEQLDQLMCLLSKEVK